MKRTILDGSRVLTSEQEERVKLADKSKTHPRQCPVCGEKLIRIKEGSRIFYECLNMVKTVTCALGADGYSACGYKWYFPKDRANIC